MQSKRKAMRLDAVGIEKSNLPVPNLIKAGIGRRFLVLIEIARHPEGLSVYEASIKCGKDGRSVWYHINGLVEEAFLTSTYEKRGDGKVEAVFRITPYGIDTIQKEMRGICEIISQVKKELISGEPIRKSGNN